jgi:hypothetical protein
VKQTILQSIQGVKRHIELLNIVNNKKMTGPVEPTPNQNKAILLNAV